MKWFKHINTCVRYSIFHFYSNARNVSKLFGHHCNLQTYIGNKHNLQVNEFSIWILSGLLQNKHTFIFLCPAETNKVFPEKHLIWMAAYAALKPEYII